MECVSHGKWGTATCRETLTCKKTQDCALPQASDCHAKCLAAMDKKHIDVFVKEQDCSRQAIKASSRRRPSRWALRWRDRYRWPSPRQKPI